jgi:vacuolar-type H+-ATPase subunit D/Vma8
MTPKHKLLLEKKDLLVAAMAAFEADLSEANEKAMNDLTSEVSILTAEVVAEEAQFAADAASLKEKSVNAPPCT